MIINRKFKRMPDAGWFLIYKDPIAKLRVSSIWLLASGIQYPANFSQNWS